MGSILCRAGAGSAPSKVTGDARAEKAGVSINIVYRIRRGYMVKMERFGKVCKALGLSPEEAIDYERMKKFKERKVK